MNMATGKILTSSNTPTVIQQGGIQYTLQPAPASAASAASASAAQGTAAFTAVTGTPINGGLSNIGKDTFS